MKSWNLHSRLLILVLAFALFQTGNALAQAGDVVRVVPLSTSGYERANALAFSSDGKFLAVGGISGIYLFDFQKLSSPDFIETDAWARSLSFVPGTHNLAAGLFDRTIKLWSVPDVNLLRTIAGPQGWVRSISVSADGSLIASASDDDTLRVWNTLDGTPALILDENMTGIRAVALSPDGSLVAAALGDKTVRVWSIPDGRLIYSLTGHTDWVRCLAFSPDGSLLASGSFDKTIRLWDISTGKVFHTMEGHTSSVLSVAFSPDGKTLASGSVDETVRLWQVASGTSLQMLMGHQDFVYAVAFSPDGQFLASGGGDNAVRIWDLEVLNGAAARVAAIGPIVSSDCRTCHHTRGQLGPARVLELSCEGCHSNGASLSWCAAFPRAGGFKATPAAYHAVSDVSGVPLNGEDLAVVINSPGNGETLYVKGDFMVPEKIIGMVFHADDATLPKIKVQLDILSDGQKFASLTTYPSESGAFSFSVINNPGKKPPEFNAPVPGIPTCRTCHDRSINTVGLPEGDIRFIVTATMPGGEQASDERWLRVDLSGKAAVPVRIIDDVTGEPIPDLMVQASTVLYEWRARTTETPSDEGGNILLNLESLSEWPTEYNLNIPAQVVNGLQYTSDNSAKVMLEPGKTSYPVVTLTAHAQTGRISGKVEGEELPAELNGIKIWAVRQPGGPAYQAILSADGSFVFEDMPIDQYLIFGEPFSLAQGNISNLGQSVDLSESPQATVSLKLMKSLQISGRITSQDGSLVPFAWITAGEEAQAVQMNTSSGKYLISELPVNANYLTIYAPGYYSLSMPVPADGSILDFQLVPRPGTRIIPWGDGKVTLSPETSAAVTDHDIELEYGWLWGEGGDTQPVRIHSSGMDLSITSGEFALESPANGTAWLFLFKGSAQVMFDDRSGPTVVKSGEMLALVEGAKPLPINDAAEFGFHPTLGEAPIPEITEPSLKAQLEDRLVKAGINAAKAVTFLAYSLLFLGLIGVPLLALLRRNRSQKKLSATKGSD